MSSDGNSYSFDDSSPYKYRLRTEKALLAKEKVSDLLHNFSVFINRINTRVGLLRSCAPLADVQFNEAGLSYLDQFREVMLDTAEKIELYMSEEKYVLSGGD
ncbi:unnamed protein product [Arabidopsis halleri]